MARTKVEMKSFVYPRVNLAAISQKELAAYGLNPRLTRCLRGLARGIQNEGAAKPRIYSKAMNAFLREYGFATEREKLVVQEIFLLSGALQDAATNGCGPEGFGGVVPDFCFEECCNDHDNCYARGGTEADRLKCDQVFYECCKEKGPDWLAWIYYQAVRRFGSENFNYHS